MFLVKGAWYDKLRSVQNEANSLPNAINLNGQDIECDGDWTEQDLHKCSCQALLCNGRHHCSNGFVVMQLRQQYTVACELTKPWGNIDLEGATVGGDSADCSCSGTFESL